MDMRLESRFLPGASSLCTAIWPRRTVSTRSPEDRPFLDEFDDVAEQDIAQRFFAAVDPGAHLGTHPATGRQPLEVLGIDYPVGLDHAAGFLRQRGSSCRFGHVD